MNSHLFECSLHVLVCQHLNMANHPYENLSKLLHESNVYVGNNFIDMYNKCGSIVDAWKMFNTMLPM